MTSFSPREFARQFRENGLKLLFHDPGNVRDLLFLQDPDRAARIDFSRLRVDPTTYVTADYRHLCSDLVLRVPYRTLLSGRRRVLTLYLLLEHQSEPDRLMMLRVLEYLVQIYRAQIRDREGRRPGRDEFVLQPVLPIVLYTGSRTWESLTSLASLVAGGTEEFADVIPVFHPLFLNLSALPSGELESSGGFLGWVLSLFRLRGASLSEYRVAVARVVDHLEAMAEQERERWLLFLSYLHSMIYHDRVRDEQDELSQVIASSVRNDARRREVEIMAQTIAEALEEQGMRRGLEKGREEALEQARREGLRKSQDTLVRLLRLRFGRVPRAVVQMIRATQDVEWLDTWLDRVITAPTLADIGIGNEQST
jgi:Putative transposase, YhgA-like